MPLPNLLAVFAHPDDESLSAGGVLARHAASGARTAVVTATWAEGTWRAAELADALRVLGAGRPRMLGYADAKVPESAPGSPRFCDAPLDEAVGRLVGHIREFRPDIVVTHDAYGGLSGHPDHVHAHRVTVLAVQAAGWGGLYPQAGAPWRPGALHLATHPDSAARALGGVLLRPGRAMYSVPDEWITAAVDVGRGSGGSWTPYWLIAVRWSGAPCRAAGRARAGGPGQGDVHRVVRAVRRRDRPGAAPARAHRVTGAGGHLSARTTLPRAPRSPASPSPGAVSSTA